MPENKSKNANNSLIVGSVPKNLQAECALLCAMINSIECRSKVKTELTSADFYRESNSLLFDIICSDTLDLVGIADELQRRGLLEKCGGQAYLMNLATMATTTVQWPHYAKIVKDVAIRRKIVEQCQATMERVLQLNKETAEILAEHHKALTDIEVGDPFKYRNAVDISNVYDAQRSLEAYRQYVKTLKKNRFITGISEIDKRIRGVGGGEVLFVIARGGTFKTSILQNFLKNYANNSAWVSLFFSIEMPVAAVVERYHQIVQGSAGRDIQDFYLADQEVTSAFVEKMEKEFVEAMKGVYTIPTRISVKDIVSYVQLVQNAQKEKVGLIGVDYIGLMDGEGKEEYQIVSNLAKNLKNLAKFLNLPVVVISQTSRRAGAGDVEISLDMARGSGVIEEAADFILGLWQDNNDLICKILKNRKGPKGSAWILDLNVENFRLGPDSVQWQSTKKRKDDSNWQDEI